MVSLISTGTPRVDTWSAVLVRGLICSSGVLSKEEQKQIQMNLREHSKEVEENDRYTVDIANTAVVEKHKRVLNEWLVWICHEMELLSDDPKLAGDATNSTGDPGKAVVEEIVEEIDEDSEEVIG
ncbi:hypothetical protein BJY01DRAFT_255251 [Aspergillus pseudoustus]|uniref:Uncharacterized protein n=1 Tax=Aspergillus pseudoustus TaxID=1810923 RepID=A0ABR4IM91_9EURO